MNTKYNSNIGYYRNQAEHAKHNKDLEAYERYKGLAEGYIRGLCDAGVISELEMDEKLRYVNV